MSFEVSERERERERERYRESIKMSVRSKSSYVVKPYHWSVIGNMRTTV